MRVISIRFLVSLLFGFSPSLMAMGGESMEGHVITKNAEQTVRATGVLKSVSDDYRSVRIFHDPIPALKWPAMNMPFEVDENVLGPTLKAGDRIHFEFIRKEDKNVIVKISQ